MNDDLKQRIIEATKQGFWCIQSGVTWIAGDPNYIRTFMGRSEDEAWRKLFEDMEATQRKPNDH